MNEIEMAISAIETALEQEPPATIEQGYGFYLIIGDALTTALTALREKAEREKGCDWCQQKHNRYLFAQIADLNAETPIACPWCGKRLEVGHEN